MGSGQVVRHQVLVLAFGGSSPSSPAIDNRSQKQIVLIYAYSITEYKLFTNRGKKYIITLNDKDFQ
jgi:hypothetical protein